MGMKVAAVSTLCLDARVFDAMWMAGTPCPYLGAIGDDAKSGWEKNPDDVPSGSLIFSKKKFGKTFPNPTVGCVIAKNSKIISKAVTNQSGRPHAEEIALAKAGHKAKGASMYVTLEPCFHSSKNGSCTDQILSLIHI